MLRLQRGVAMWEAGVSLKKMGAGIPLLPKNPKAPDKKTEAGSSLMVSVFPAGARVQSLVRELRSCKPSGVAKKFIIINK